MTPGEVGCILLAAGSGVRLGAATPKALTRVGGEPLLAHSLRSVLAAPSVSRIVVTAPAGFETPVGEVVERVLGQVPESAETTGGDASDRAVRVITGGVGRSDSVALAEGEFGDDCSFVLVHDSARALAPPELFETVVSELMVGAEGVVPARPVADTVKVVQLAPNGNGGRVELVERTLDRAGLRAVQTPQGFRREWLSRALADPEARAVATDDASLIEAVGGRVRVIPGHPEAFKITYPLDVLLAEAVLERRRMEDVRKGEVT